MWPGNSRDTRTLPSLVFKLYIEQILSKPPHATKLPDGAYAHVITQDERNGIACTYNEIVAVVYIRVEKLSLLPHNAGESALSLFLSLSLTMHFYFMLDIAAKLSLI